MDSKEISEKIKIAKKLVEEEEEPYKTVAFQVIFSKLLDENSVSNKNNESNAESIKNKPTTQEIKENYEDILDKIDVNKLEFLTSLESVHDKSIALLAYVSKNVRQLKGLTSGEMKEALAEKFGLTTITVNNISMSLKNVTGKYVTRKEILVKTKTGATKKFRYEILQKGLEYIEKKITEVTKTKEQNS